MISVSMTIPRKSFDVILNEQFNTGITGIFGASGSGKTTLLNCIAGLEHPSQGSISIYKHCLFDSKKQINLPIEKRAIGYVFQEGRLFPHLTVEQNLRFGIKPNQKDESYFSEIITLLNLRHLLQSSPNEISGGEQQRTALARALLSSPDLLLLDEPFSALDTELRGQIIPFLLKIQKAIHIPILVVSHELQDILKLTNRLCILRKGRCVGHDEYHTLLQDKSLSEICNTSHLLNVMELTVNSVDKENSIATLEVPDTDNSIRITVPKSRHTLESGNSVKLFLYSNEIALSTHRISSVTIQNQVQGTITEMIQRSGIVLCTIDIGVTLIAEITQDSCNRLSLVEGNVVWCLFKSVAIDTVY
ncbi:MAG: molybdenum ABC transporter ATP-binding protein [Reichenbachiella sp.]